MKETQVRTCEGDTRECGAVVGSDAAGTSAVYAF